MVGVATKAAREPNEPRAGVACARNPFVVSLRAFSVNEADACACASFEVKDTHTVTLGGDIALESGSSFAPAPRSIVCAFEPSKCVSTTAQVLDLPSGGTPDARSERPAARSTFFWEVFGGHGSGRFWGNGSARRVFVACTSWGAWGRPGNRSSAEAIFKLFAVAHF